MRIFIFLHVATMFSAVAASLGPAYVLGRIGRHADVPTIRRAFALNQPLAAAIGPLFTGGAILGIVAVFTNGFDPLAPWLLIAYVLVAAATFTGITINGPWLRRVTSLSAESPDGAPSAELTATLNDPKMHAVDWFDRIVILVLIFDMVVKPFS